jgi:hypothetical protein
MLLLAPVTRRFFLAAALGQTPQHFVENGFTALEFD